MAQNLDRGTALAILKEVLPESKLEEALRSPNSPPFLSPQEWPIPSVVFTVQKYPESLPQETVAAYKQIEDDNLELYGHLVAVGWIREEPVCDLGRKLLDGYGPAHCFAPAHPDVKNIHWSERGISGERNIRIKLERTSFGAVTGIVQEGLTAKVEVEIITTPTDKCKRFAPILSSLQQKRLSNLPEFLGTSRVLRTWPQPEVRKGTITYLFERYDDGWRVRLR